MSGLIITMAVDLQGIKRGNVEKLVMVMPNSSDMKRSLRPSASLRADDFVILWNGSKVNSQTFISPQEIAVDIVTMKEQVKQFLKDELELELSEDKTLITHVRNGFDFLGFHIQRYKTRVGNMTITSVPKDKILRFKQKIQMTTRGKGASYENVSSKIMAVNSIVNGWAEYYKAVNSNMRMIRNCINRIVDKRVFNWMVSR